MDIDKNAYWVAHQPMRSISDADRAKLQRRATLQTPPTRAYQKQVLASSLDPELRDIFEKKLKASAFFKPVVAETTPDIPAAALVSPELEPIPSRRLPEQPIASESPTTAPEEGIDNTELPSSSQDEMMKKKSILLTRTLLFAERRKKEGREVFRRRTVADAALCPPDTLRDETDRAVHSFECDSASLFVPVEPEWEEKEKKESVVAATEKVVHEDADTVASFPKLTDTSFSSVDLTDRASENPWPRPNEIIFTQLKQLSHVVVDMIHNNLEEKRKAGEKEEEDPKNPQYSAPLPESDKFPTLKWYERPFKTHPFEYIPRPSPRFNCLCPGMVDF